MDAFVSQWQEKIAEYCDLYNIPIKHLADTLYEPKVIPMIRGKAFEYSVVMTLKNILPCTDWDVIHMPMNAQTGFHDVDVEVIHRTSGNSIRIECKLAKKGSFQALKDGQYKIKVKCMRSRTLGDKMVKSMAKQWGVRPSVLKVHNDQYLPTNFDIVVTSIGNAFYETNQDSIFIWKPSKAGMLFLRNLGATEIAGLKDFAFNKMFAARSTDIVIGKDTGVECTRRSCKNKRNCGFIPNYPAIIFSDEFRPINGWTSLDNSLRLFSDMACPQ